ncbi:myogenesis-regulating glycosidase-like [Haliotis asinina]|uniref:myogenesis-regulating glycosidase-like n=1 Tax=Haliotis asinina TaxID=109174 RepID=UPI00353219A0
MRIILHPLILLVVCLCRISGFLLDPLSPQYITQNHGNVTLGHAVINVQHRRIAFVDDNGQTKIHGNLGMTFPSDTPASVVTLEGNTNLHVTWPGVADLNAKSFTRNGTECTQITMEARSCVSQILQDCYNMEGSHWYGGAEMRHQLWPLEKVSTGFGPYVINGNHMFPYGSVQERYFFSSSGMAYYIDEDVPLFVAINSSGNHQLCFQAKYFGVTYRNYDMSLPLLSYTVCQAQNALSIHQAMSGWYFKKPNGIPNENMLRKPIWSTWPEYMKSINQTLVLQFASELQKYNMDVSNFEIDQQWMPNVGDIEFDLERFPDPKDMISELHRKGWFATCWIPPFVNTDSANFELLAAKGHLLKDMSGERPALAKWWEANYTGVIDFTNTNASKWYFDSLAVLRTKYGVDSFKFDGGDANYVPAVYKPYVEFRNPSVFSRAYVEGAASFDDISRRHEVRSGSRTQHVPGFVRMVDRYSNWSDQGFKSILTASLVFGILGYPFVLPGVVGGNLQDDIPDAELFVRWVQATTLLPSMQFGLKPWRYNSTVVQITQNMLNLRTRYADKIVHLAKQSVTSGFPIVRPLWWIAPTDESALTVDDEFLVGDDLLVAPVMDPGVSQRRIYLPGGTWRDEITGGTLVGGRWIDYHVRLEDLPHFAKLA